MFSQFYQSNCDSIKFYEMLTTLFNVSLSTGFSIFISGNREPDCYDWELFFLECLSVVAKRMSKHNDRAHSS